MFRNIITACSARKVQKADPSHATPSVQYFPHLLTKHFTCLCCTSRTHFGANLTPLMSTIMAAAIVVLEGATPMDEGANPHLSLSTAYNMKSKYSLHSSVQTCLLLARFGMKSCNGSRCAQW